MKILAIKLRRLGDTALWTAALNALCSISDAEVDIAFPDSYSPLFESDPRFLDKFPISENTDYRKTWRKKKYDWVLGFHANRQTLFLAMASGGRHRLLHHHSRNGKNYFSEKRIVDLGKPMPAIERDLNVVRTLGWKGTTPPTQIHVSHESKNQGRLVLEKAGVSFDRPLLILGLGASRRSKLWPMEHFWELAGRLGNRFEVVSIFEPQHFFLGGDLWKTKLKQSCKVVPTPHLRDVLSILPHAKIYFGSDSGIKHVAAALGIATVTAFGPESIGEWHGYPEPHRALQVEVACRNRDLDTPSFRWCAEEICPLAAHPCMRLITPERAEAAILETLSAVS